MILVAEIKIEKGTDSDASALKQLKRHAELGGNVNCIYVYSLLEKEIPYPIKDGKVIYIGEACRKIQTGARFCGHISENYATGNNYVSNRAISSYYHNGNKIKLQIFTLPPETTKSERKSKETELIRSHVKVFGSKPVAQGSTGGSFTGKALSKIIISEAIQRAIVL